MTDDTSKVPNAPGWWLRVGEAGDVFDIVRVIVNQRDELVWRDDSGDDWRWVHDNPSYLLWGSRLIPEDEHTEAVRLAEERSQDAALTWLRKNGFGRIASLADAVNVLHMSAIDHDTEMAALRAELEAAKARVQQLEIQEKAENEVVFSARHARDVEVPRLRARIAELEVTRDALLESAADWQRNYMSKAAELARMKAERDEARRHHVLRVVEYRHVTGMYSLANNRVVAVEAYGTEWADEHFPEGT